MTNKKDLIIAILATFCLTATLFMIIPSRSQGSNNYDPWCDLNHDGKIDILDVVMVTSKYATTGTRINTTQLLLELNATVHDLEVRMSPQKGIVLISPSAFAPWTNIQQYNKHTVSGLAGWATFDAPLQLPIGATLTNLSVCLTDLSDQAHIMVYLERYNITSPYHTYELMANVSTTDPQTIYPADQVVLYNDTINYAKIDENCFYTLTADFSQYIYLETVNWVQIEYEYLP